MDRIERFRVFVRVTDCASFSRAAESLGLPRSTVSAAIQDIEALVGATLLHRTTRKVIPTPEGLEFYDRCVRLIADFEETQSAFRKGESAVRGKLRVSVPGRIGRLVIAPALPEFLARYPEIEISFGATDRMVNLVEDAIDCAVRVGTIADNNVAVHPFGELRLINVASPAYLRRYGTPRKPADLVRHVAVSYETLGGVVAPWEWTERGHVRTRTMRSHVTVNNAEAYIACSLAGLGLIQIPAYDVKAHIASGELVAVMKGYCAEPMPLVIVYPKGRRISRRVQAFAEWAESLLKRELFAPDRAKARTGRSKPPLR